MKIKELHLQNFRGFEDVTIQFPESNVCVFIGANGSGKSSVLDAVFIMLEGSFRQSDSLFDSRSNLHKDDVQIGFEKAKYGLKLEFDKEVFDLKADQTYNYSNSSISLASNKKEFIDKVQQSQHSPLFQKYSAKRFVLGKQQAINFAKEIDKRNILIHQFFIETKNFDEFIIWFKDLEDAENAEKIAKKDFKINNTLLNFIRKASNIFLTEFNENTFNNLKVFREKTTIETEVNGKSETTLMIDKNGVPFKLQQLSDGEKLILMTVCDIARKLILLNPKLDNPLQGEGVILIDEIELHLHPQWQRNVIPALQKTFPNIQFIITTHSPQVLSNIDKSEIRILKDWQVYEPSCETLGSDTNYILESIMETDKSPAEEELREVFKLINDKKFVEAEMVANKLVADKKISVNNLVFHRIESFKERMAILNK